MKSTVLAIKVSKHSSHLTAINRKMNKDAVIF